MSDEDLVNRLEWGIYEDHFKTTKMMIAFYYDQRLFDVYHIVVEPMTSTQIDHIFDEAKDINKKRIEREKRGITW